jgi:hypothetical protein
MIIIEGPDSSGKTRLAQKLSQDLGNIVIHNFGGPPKDYTETIDRAFKSIALMTQRVIQDRTPLISEPVYGRFMRNENIEHITCSMSFPIIKQMAPVIIYCRPPTSSIKDLSLHKIKKHDTAEYIADLVKYQANIIYRYDKMMDILRPNRYDYTHDECDCSYNNILKACTLRFEGLQGGFETG